VGPRAGLDDVEKRKFLVLPELELQPLGRPARSQSLSRLQVIHLENLLRSLHGGEWSAACSDPFTQEEPTILTG
jgi:hypothetical protein